MHVNVEAPHTRHIHLIAEQKYTRPPKIKHMKGNNMKLQTKTYRVQAKKVVKGVMLAGFLCGLASSAQAALISCTGAFTTDPTSKVEDATGTMTATSACQYITPADSSNTAKLVNINAAGFFGTSTWVANSLANTQLDPGNDLTDTWSITNANFALYDYIIVFKDGDGTNLTAFLFNELFTNGVWSSPFASPIVDVSNPKEVSHYTIAQRDAVEVPCNPQIEDCRPREIPEPTSIALMSLGMLGAAVALKRSRSHRRG